MWSSKLKRYRTTLIVTFKKKTLIVICFDAIEVFHSKLHKKVYHEKLINNPPATFANKMGEGVNGFC